MGRPPTDIRERILVAARARFLEDGVDGASLRTIAKAARTSVGMIFYYYPTKDALFLGVVEEVYAKLLANLEAILLTNDPLKDRLRATFSSIGLATSDEIDVLRLVVREAILASPRFRQVLSRFGRGHIGMLFTALADAVARGEVDGAIPLPVLAVTTLAMGGVPQVARRIATAEIPFAALPSAEQLAQASVDALFGGIGPKTAPPTRRSQPRGRGKAKTTTGRRRA